MFLPIVVTVLTGYLLGNLNGAVNMSFLIAHQDVRTQGSGNAGLTNFVRNYGVAKAIYVVLIDMAKTILACLVGKLAFPEMYATEGIMAGALAVSLGHDFPALLGFKGGKGILCGLSVAIVLDYRCALIILGVFGICFAITRYVSLSSILAAIAFSVSIAVFYWDISFVMYGGIFLGLLAIFMHRANIVRLIKGTESKMTFSKKKNKE